MAVQESRLLISIDARNAERTAKALNSELQGITNNGAKADNQINAMGGSLKALAGYMGGILTISSAISMADGYTQMAARIRNATSSAAEYELVQERILATANTTFRSLGEAQEVYLSMAGGMKSLGYQTTQTLDLVDSLSFSFTHNATRADQAQSAMDSLSKSMAKGKIDADAWISIVTGADNVIADMAKTTGKTEAEIRKLGAEGKASLEDLIKTLIATRDENERLANNMENSLADGFTKLSNEVTVYLGKANEATSATGLMAGALTVLADNLDLVANAALVGGIGYITKAILTKTVAVQGAIAASMAQRAANAAEAQSSIAVATAKVNEAKAHLANVQATNAETRAKYGAAAANARYKLASDAVTKALIAQTAAQGALNSSVTLGSRALALVGGPIGAITIGVSALAAGYLLLRDNSKKAESALVTQGKTVAELTEEYRKLDALQRAIALRKLEEDFKGLKEASDDAQLALYKLTEEIRRNSGASRSTSLEAQRLFQEYNAGTITSGQFYDAMKALNIMSDKQKEKLMDLTNEHSKAKAEYVESNIQIKALTGENEKLAKSQDASANAANRQAAGIANSTEAAAKAAAAMKSLADRQRDNEYILKNYKVLGGLDAAKAALRFKEEMGLDSSVAFNAEQRKAFDNWLKSENAVKSINSEIKKSTDSTKQQAKAQADLNRLREDQARMRKSLSYDFSTDLQKMKIDYESVIADINDANFSPALRNQFLSAAKARFEDEQVLYKMKQAFELQEHKLNEEAKAKATFIIDQQIIANRTDINTTGKKQYLNALKDRANYELAQIQLAKETRMFQMKEAFLSETDAMNQRYALEERRIMQIRDIEEREFALKMNRLKQEEEQRKRIQNAQIKMGGIQAQNNGTSGFVDIETTRFDQIAASEELFQAQLAVNFEAREQLWRDHEERVTEINRAADAARLNLQMDYGQQITGSFADIFKNIAGEQSNGYKLMFTAQKAFAIAQSAMAIQQGIAQAFALPFPLNLVAAATVAAQTASIISNIKSIRAEGFKDGGYTGNMGRNQVAGVVHGQEYVLNADATRRVGRGTLDALNNGGTLESGGGVNVIINVPQGYKAVQTQSENGVTIDIVENMINQSWGNVNRPNSNESRAIQGAFGIAPKR